MHELYRRIVSKNGRVRYERIFQWDVGDPRPGIWAVRRQGVGVQRTWLQEYVSPLCENTPALAWIAGRHGLVTSVLSEQLSQETPRNAYKMAAAVIDALLAAARADGGISE